MANRRHPMQLPRMTATIAGIVAVIAAIITLRVSASLIKSKRGSQAAPSFC